MADTTTTTETTTANRATTAKPKKLTGDARIFALAVRLSGKRKASIGYVMPNGNKRTVTLREGWGASGANPDAVTASAKANGFKEAFKAESRMADGGKPNGAEELEAGTDAVEYLNAIREECDKNAK